MRHFGAILALCLAITPALAQQPAPKAPPAQGPKQVYAAMSEADRTALQSDLVWTGDYNGLVNGDFNDRSVAAVRAFQKNNGGKETGILNPQERTALAAAAKAARDRAGWRIVTDNVSGAQLGLPSKLAPQSAAQKDGTRWTAQQKQVQIETFRISSPGTTLAGIFEQQQKNPGNRKVEYRVIRPDFFVVTGLQGLQKFYVRAGVRNDEVRGITILYDQAMDGIMAPVVVAMSSAFVPFPSATAATINVPAPRKKVEYTTGIVVSADGHILADRYATDDCGTITITGYGDAERRVNDRSPELALLRIHGAEHLVPASLGADASATDLTLAGIADPQSQNGGRAVSRARVKLSPARSLEPAPPLGFAGAAVLDASGHIAGMVAGKPAVVAGPGAAGPGLVPVSGMRAFLASMRVTPAVSPQASDPVASLVRVICVRK